MAKNRPVRNGQILNKHSKSPQLTRGSEISKGLINRKFDFLTENYPLYRKQFSAELLSVHHT